MKRIKENYHTFHVLKHARPKLRKAVISISDRDLVNCFSECVLNVLNGNVGLTSCVKRKLSKLKLAMRKLVYKEILIVGKKRLISQGGCILLPFMEGVMPTFASLITAK